MLRGYVEFNTPSSGVPNVNRTCGIIPVNLKIKNSKISTGFTREVYKSDWFIYIWFKQTVRSRNTASSHLEMCAYAYEGRLSWKKPSVLGMITLFKAHINFHTAKPRCIETRKQVFCFEVWPCSSNNMQLFLTSLKLKKSAHDNEWQH